MAIARAAGSWNRALVIAITLTALPAAASAQIQLRRGSEFQVNAFTTGLQWEPAVAVGPNGDFVVAWSSKTGSGEAQKIMARRFHLSGAPIGPELIVSTATAVEQRTPAVSATRDGEFVVVWSGGHAAVGDALGVFGRVIDASGQLVGPEFLVNEHTPGAQWEPAIAADAAGNITVAWSGNGGDWDYDGISARRLTHRGQPLTPQVEVNTWIAGVQSRPAVASTPEGDFIVLWQGAPSDRVHARRFTAEGTPILSPFLINTNMDPYSGPAAACDADGNVFMASTGVGADGDGAGVNGLRMLSNGGFDAGEFVVNSYTAGSQSAPSVAEYAGNFVVVWTSSGQDGDWDGVYGQRYDTDLQRIGTEFRINSYTTNYQSEPAVASDAKGNWVVVWTSGPVGRDGSGAGIYAQQYAPDLIFDNGFETGGLSAWSGSNPDGGDLSVTTAAALNGFRGLQGVVDDRAGLWVQDSSPADEPRYRARFYFDTNGFDPGEALDHRRVMLFVAFAENPVRRLVTITLRRLGGAYSVRGSVRLDDNTLFDSPFHPITDGPHFIELDWKRARTPESKDGAFSMWIDDVSVGGAQGLDNNLGGVDFVRMGAISVKAGASGTLYWDHFRSRRLSRLGPW